MTHSAQHSHRRLSPRRLRVALRACHLALAFVAAFAIFPPVLPAAAARDLLRPLFLAFLVTGVVMWQQPRLRRLTKKAAARLGRLARGPQAAIRSPAGHRSATER